MSLYNKYRPRSLKTLIGNDSVKASLEQMLAKGISRFPHTVLLSGQPGCGKTTVARIIASTLGAVNRDVHELNCAKKEARGIDAMQEVESRCRLRPMESPASVWVLDEVHMLTNPAQSSLLKLLEEPPRTVFFVLCTTEPEKLLSTIVSRATPFTLSQLDDDSLMRLMKRVARKEGIEIDDAVLDQICIECLGSARTALSILETCLGLSKQDALGVVKSTQAKRHTAIALARALMDGDKGTVVKVLKSLADDPESVRLLILRYFSSSLLRSGSKRMWLIMDCFMQPFYNAGRDRLIHACFTAMLGVSK